METKKEYISVGGTPTESSLRQDATSAQRKAAKAAARSGASLPVADLNQWLHTPEREYYDLVRRSEIRDGAKKLRKQYLRYLITIKQTAKHFSYSSRSGNWPALPPKKISLVF